MGSNEFATGTSACWGAHNGVNSAETSMSIAEMVAQTASDFITDQFLPGYVYSEEYGMYYSQESGYYYDSKTSLFYHPYSQCYYRYNDRTKEYETFHTNPILAPPKWTKKKNRKRALQVLGDCEKLDQMEVDVLETVFEVVDKCAFLAGDFLEGGKDRRVRKMERRKARGIKKIFAMADNCTMEEYPDIPEIMVTQSTSRSYKPIKQTQAQAQSSESEEDTEDEAEVLRRWMVEEESSKHGCCIRLMESNTSRPAAPTLHIITINGCAIGFGPEADIQLTAREGKRMKEQVLLSISYKENAERPKESYYQVEFLKGCKDFGGVKVNDEVFRGTSSTTHQLKHEDTIRFGSHHLLFHLHNGLNTCQGCEPGLFVQPTTGDSSEKPRMKPRSVHAQRRFNNRLMKEQYGLLEPDEDIGELPHKKGYVDRAKKRRKQQDSTSLNSKEMKIDVNPAGGIYANCKAAPQPGTSITSVQLRTEGESTKPVGSILEKTNSKGLQLLKGMGWQEGQGLGKNQQGMQEPIVSTLKVNRAGFGLESSKISIKLNGSKVTEKQSILEKTRQRYEQAGKDSSK